MMLNKLIKIQRCSPSERRLLFQALLLLPLSALGVRVLGFKRYYAGLSSLANGSRPIISSKDEEESIRRVRRAFALAVNHGPYKGNCLSRSLTLWCLLRRQGIECDLRIGVRKKNGQFEAHAWIEYQDRPLSGGAKVREDYAVFGQVIVPRR